MEPVKMKARHIWLDVYLGLNSSKVEHGSQQTGGILGHGLIGEPGI